MGYYINPKIGSKEMWLYENGEIVTKTEAESCLNEKPITGLPVCLVDNGAFTAAGIAYSLDELRVFLEPRDYRPKLLFVVPLNKLKEVVPEIEEAIKRGH